MLMMLAGWGVLGEEPAQLMLMMLPWMGVFWEELVPLMLMMLAVLVSLG